MSELVKTAVWLWGNNKIYWDGRAYRWSRVHGRSLPLGAVKGRIATPYNKALKGIGPKELHDMWEKGILA